MFLVKNYICWVIKKNLEEDKVRGEKGGKKEAEPGALAKNLGISSFKAILGVEEAF